MDAPNSTSQSQGPQNAVPKENTPPPAYTPRRVSDIPSVVAVARMIQEARRERFINMARNVQLPQPLPQPQQAACAAMFSGAAFDNQDEAPSEGSSPISLRIDTSVSVARNNNIVCLTATPAEQANAIARAVVQALHEGSSGQCGIPMIDESGCPRPLEIDVDAGLAVEGTGNIIGGREVISELVRQRVESSLRRPRDEDEEEATPAKRRRASH
ncbi:hypothetical protein F66182_4610 [Fusarium sp. NRRL 66182]|nr:hypothetical protein F66182_4610 [Fusarium sp. NRRL 66182]